MLSLLNFIDLTAVIIFIVVLALWIIFNGFVLYRMRDEVKEWKFEDMAMYAVTLMISVVVLLFAAIILSIIPKAIFAGFLKLVF